MNTPTEINHAAKDAFAGAVAGIEASTGLIPGYAGYESHAYAVPLNPTYQFEVLAFMTLCYTWNREMMRQEHEPRRGLWIGGPKGAGKTTFVEQFFARLGIPVVSITCNRRQPLSDYVQRLVPDGEGGWTQVSGPLLIAMERGFPVVLNEPSAMDPADLIAMHDIIDRGVVVLDDGQIRRAKQGFVVYATDNTMGHGDSSGAFGGTNVLNAATMSRFLKWEMGYPTRDDETKILMRIFPNLGTDALERFTDFAGGVRDAYVNGASGFTMGTREVIDWVHAAMYFQGLSARGMQPAWFALERVISGIEVTDMSAAKALYESVFGVRV